MLIVEPTQTQLKKLKPGFQGDFCPKGYTNILDQQWQGINAGCNCTGIFDIKLRNQNGFTEGQCNLYELMLKCNNTKEVSAIKLQVLDGKVICKKPLTEQASILNLESLNENGQCRNSTYKMCGP